MIIRFQLLTMSISSLSLYSRVDRKNCPPFLRGTHPWNTHWSVTSKLTSDLINIVVQLTSPKLPTLTTLMISLKIYQLAPKFVCLLTTLFCIVQYDLLKTAKFFRTIWTPFKNGKNYGRWNSTPANATFYKFQTKEILLILFIVQ